MNKQTLFTYTVTFKDGSFDVFLSNKKDWQGHAIGRNQSQSLNTIKNVEVK